MARFRHPSECPLAWIDTETGGLNPNTAALLEVAVIITDSTGRTIRDRWEAKLLPYPEDEMDPEALRINGYDAARWGREAPPRAQVWDQISTLCSGAIFAAHNVTFDHGMIMRFLRRWGTAEWPGPHWKVDTVSLAWPLLARRLVPDLKLTTLTSYFKIPHEHAHTAMADAEAARLVYVALMDLYSPGTATRAPQQATVFRPWHRVVADDPFFKESLDNDQHQITGVPGEPTLPGV